MANKRQRLARKRYKSDHPELFPKPEPTPPKDPTKKKKESTMFKKKKYDSADPNKPNKKGFKKHPLRVPGMKPGDSCFICKAPDHIARDCPKKTEWERNKICLLCRQRGHSLKRCPNKDDETVVDKKLCYNCGDSGHSLSNCPYPLQDGGTKFANCFICNKQGHLSKDCPKNTHGIYPKGGCCKICGGVTHLAKDCLEKGKKDFDAARKEVTEMVGRPKVTKFTSGDDLDDDFITETTHGNQKEKSDLNQGDLQDGQIKSKKKKAGHRVVNFVG